MANPVVSDTPEALPPEPSPSRPAWWLLALVGGVLAVGAAMWFKPAEPAAAVASPDMKAEKDALTVAPKAPQWKFIKLGTVGTSRTHWTDTVPGRISIDDTRASKIGAPVAGRVSRVLVELGQNVVSGQPLFAVTSPEIAELRNARDQASVELDAARVALTRIEATVAARALPAKELEAARQRVRQAELSVQMSDAKLASLRATAAAGHEVVVNAPRSGVVVEKNIFIDQQVSPDAGAALLTVADLSVVWVVADVFEAQAIEVRLGDAAEVTTPSLPATTLKGTVHMVPSIGDPERHTLPIRVQLANPDGRLRPNVYARVRFAVQQRGASLEVPATAVVSDGEKQYVYVQDTPGHFVRREIVAGSVREGRLPVMTGLSNGETIVEDGAILLDNQIDISQ